MELTTTVAQLVLFCCRDEDEPEMIEDSSAEKPDGWLDDEPELVADDNAEKPEDWSVHPPRTVYDTLYFC